MNTQTLTKLALVTAIFILSSCGTSKSSKTTTEIISSSTVTDAGSKILTSCQKATGSDISVNISAIKDEYGNINNNLIKVKFNYLSQTVTTAGNTIRFFKWKVSGSQAYLDPNNLSAIRYDLASGNIDSSAQTSLNPNSISTTKGYYIELNDTEGLFQVLKVVVYNSSGSIATQMNILIPQFLGKPSDYAYNSDGSPRAQILQDMHPLRNTNTTGWTTQNYQTYYQASCF